MALISGPDYDMVRKAIDVSLTAATVPDAVIALPIYQGAAERAVISVVPTAQAIVDANGPDALRIKAATSLLVAALLVDRIPHVVRESLIGNSIEVQRIDLSALESSLRRQAADELAVITGDAALTLPVQFTVARGNRGRLRYPLTSVAN